MARGQEARSAGHFAEALNAFKHAASVAHAAGDTRTEALALHRAAGCQIRLFRYSDALASATAARDLSLRINDSSLAGTAANNRATIYQQVGDFALAANAAEEAVRLLEKSGRGDYLASALLNYGEVLTQLGDTSRSIVVLQRALTMAHSAKSAAVEALVDDHLGDISIEARRYDAADKALREALRLHLELKDRDAAAVTRATLAALAYWQGKSAYALQLLDASVATRSVNLSMLPPYWAEHERGRILLALGRKPEALTEFRHAVAAAQMWRRSSLPGDTTSTRTAVALHEVYSDYITLAAELSIATHNPALARSALAVLMEDRAASLREQMIATLQRQMTLPPRYFELLSQLQEAQAAVTLGANSKDVAATKVKLDRIRLDLTELENSVGFRQRAQTARSASEASSVAGVQERLRPTEVLLSFSLGAEQSFLWAVTTDSVHIYRLPGADKLNHDAHDFSRAVQNGGSVQSGLALADELFGQLQPAVAHRPDWLVAGDGALLDSLPFSCLPDVTGSDRMQPLAVAHTIRSIPSELMLTDGRTPQPRPSFIGVADPIYNLADVRRVGSAPFVSVRKISTRVTLARLAGSEHEVRSAAALTGFGSIGILSGSASTIQNLRVALETPPEVLHFAVHVVSPQGSNGTASPDEAALALSLTDENIPELLTKETIATFHVPGTLVVLSGCASQQGEVLPS
ncbi:MAG: CHAT domain-containing protein, partial [Acidobacteriaceae bacterium]|nr:CHAT domain-containing protein [Acidobacteriaceae bacterium]